MQNKKHQRCPNTRGRPPCRRRHEWHGPRDKYLQGSWQLPSRVPSGFLNGPMVVKCSESAISQPTNHWAATLLNHWSIEKADARAFYGGRHVGKQSFFRGHFQSYYLEFLNKSRRIYELTLCSHIIWTIRYGSERVFTWVSSVSLG